MDNNPSPSDPRVPPVPLAESRQDNSLRQRDDLIAGALAGVITRATWREEVQRRLLEVISSPANQVPHDIGELIGISKLYGFEDELWLLKERAWETYLEQVETLGEREEANRAEKRLEDYLCQGGRLAQLEPGLEFIGRQVTLENTALIADIVARDANGKETIIELKSPEHRYRTKEVSVQLLGYLEERPDSRVVLVAPYMAPSLFSHLKSYVEQKRLSFIEVSDLEPGYQFTAAERPGMDAASFRRFIERKKRASKSSSDHWVVAKGRNGAGKRRRSKAGTRASAAGGDSKTNTRAEEQQLDEGTRFERALTAILNDGEVVRRFYSALLRPGGEHCPELEALPRLAIDPQALQALRPARSSWRMSRILRAFGYSKPEPTSRPILIYVNMRQLMGAYYALLEGAEEVPRAAQAALPAWEPTKLKPGITSYELAQLLNEYLQAGLPSLHTSATETLRQLRDIVVKLEDTADWKNANCDLQTLVQAVSDSVRWDYGILLAQRVKLLLDVSPGLVNLYLYPWLESRQVLLPCGVPFSSLHQGDDLPSLELFLRDHDQLFWRLKERFLDGRPEESARSGASLSHADFEFPGPLGLQNLTALAAELRAQTQVAPFAVSLEQLNDLRQLLLSTDSGCVLHYLYASRKNPLDSKLAMAGIDNIHLVYPEDEVDWGEVPTLDTSPEAKYPALDSTPWEPIFVVLNNYLGTMATENLENLWRLISVAEANTAVSLATERLGPSAGLSKTSLAQGRAKLQEVLSPVFLSFAWARQIEQILERTEKLREASLEAAGHYMAACMGSIVNNLYPSAEASSTALTPGNLARVAEDAASAYQQLLDRAQISPDSRPDTSERLSQLALLAGQPGPGSKDLLLKLELSKAQKHQLEKTTRHFHDLTTFYEPLAQEVSGEHRTQILARLADYAGNAPGRPAAKNGSAEKDTSFVSVLWDYRTIEKLLAANQDVLSIVDAFEQLSDERQRLASTSIIQLQEGLPPGANFSDETRVIINNLALAELYARKVARGRLLSRINGPQARMYLSFTPTGFIEMLPEPAVRHFCEAARSIYQGPDLQEKLLLWPFVRADEQLFARMLSSAKITDHNGGTNSDTKHTLSPEEQVLQAASKNGPRKLSSPVLAGAVAGLTRRCLARDSSPATLQHLAAVFTQIDFVNLMWRDKTTLNPEQIHFFCERVGSRFETSGSFPSKDETLELYHQVQKTPLAKHHRI